MQSGMPSSQNLVRSSSSMKMPVGLLGLMMSISLVFSLTAASMPSTSYCRSGSRNGIWTFTAPHRPAREGNISNVGIEHRNSSPGFMKMRIIASMVSDEPLATAMFSGPTPCSSPSLARSRSIRSG